MDEKKNPGEWRSEREKGRGLISRERERATARERKRERESDSPIEREKSAGEGYENERVTMAINVSGGSSDEWLERRMQMSAMKVHL